MREKIRASTFFPGEKGPPQSSKGRRERKTERQKGIDAERTKYYRTAKLVLSRYCPRSGVDGTMESVRKEDVGTASK